MKLEPHTRLRYQPRDVTDKMDLLIPSLNHTHRSIMGDTKGARDLTGREVVGGATEAQLEWMRKQGLIA